MSDALTDGERMTREHAARTAGGRYCRVHEHGYQDACMYCVADRLEQEDAVSYVTKRFTDEFRRVLADYGHPQERIDWLCSLVETPGLGEPIQTFAEFDQAKPELPPRMVVLQWTPSNTDTTVRLEVQRADLRLAYWVAPLSIVGEFVWRSYGSTFCGDYQRLGSLVWQDAIQALGIKTKGES